MARVALKTSRTDLADPDAAADKLMDGLGDAPTLAIMFASSDRDQRALNQAVRARLPGGTRLIGASSAAEIDRDGMHTGSVVLAGLSGDLEVGLGLGRDLTRDAFAAGEAAMVSACSQLGVNPLDLDPEKAVGLVIDDGFRMKKEEMLMGALSRHPGLVLVGGGASDSEMDPAKQKATIHVDGEVASDAVLVAMLRTEASWAALRSHWFEPTGTQVRITKVDDTSTRALEIDGEPAAARYAELLGISVDELGYEHPNGFASHPTGIRVGSEIFLRSPFLPLPDGSVQFVNMLMEGSLLELMRRRDLVESTRDFVQRELPSRLRSPSATLMFDCGARRWIASMNGAVDQLSKIYGDAPSPAGMTVQFEIYCGFAISSTLTVLAFGEST